MTTNIRLKKYPTYKHSGVDWLGEIPEHWGVIRLGSLLKDISEKNHPNLTLLSITREKGVIIRNVEDNSTNHNFIPDELSGYKLLKKGQFGMNKMKAWQGSYGVSPKTGIVSPAYYTFDFTKPILPHFFHLAIRSHMYISYFGSASDGVRVGQWDLSKDRMKKIPFFLPPLSEQTAIANFLDDKTAKIDKAIAKKEQLIALLKEQKQIIIQNAVTKGLNPKVSLKDSGVEWIGEIPEHWEVGKLKYYTHQIVDGAHFTPTYIDTGIPFLRVTDISNEFSSEINWNNTKYISKKEHNELIKRANPKKGDVLLSKNGTIGITKVIDWDKEFSFFVSLCLIKLTKKINPYFFCQFFDSPLVNRQVTFGSSKTSVTNLHLEKIKELLVIIPPINEQSSLSDELKKINFRYREAITQQLEQIQKLKEYKATLIDSAVTGKINLTNYT